jgi:hypothetical protein
MGEEYNEKVFAVHILSICNGLLVVAGLLCPIGMKLIFTHHG